MVWSLETDDFRAKCHNRPFHLIKTIRETFEGNSAGGLVWQAPQYQIKNNQNNFRKEHEQSINSIQNSKTSQPELSLGEALDFINGFYDESINSKSNHVLKNKKKSDSRFNINKINYNQQFIKPQDFPPFPKFSEADTKNRIGSLEQQIQQNAWFIDNNQVNQAINRENSGRSVRVNNNIRNNANVKSGETVTVDRNKLFSAFETFMDNVNNENLQPQEQLRRWKNLIDNLEPGTNQKPRIQNQQLPNQQINLQARTRTNFNIPQRPLVEQDGIVKPDSIDLIFPFGNKQNYNANRGTFEVRTPVST